MFYINKFLRNDWANWAEVNGVLIFSTTNWTDYADFLFMDKPLPRLESWTTLATIRTGFLCHTDSTDIHRLFLITQLSEVIKTTHSFLTTNLYHAAQGVSSVPSVQSVWTFTSLTDSTDPTEFCLTSFILYHFSFSTAQRRARRFFC